MNVMGKPMASSEKDAKDLMDTTGLDAVMVGDRIERKCKKFL